MKTILNITNEQANQIKLDYQNSNYQTLVELTESVFGALGFPAIDHLEFSKTSVKVYDRNGNKDFRLAIRELKNSPVVECTLYLMSSKERNRKYKLKIWRLKWNK